MFRGFSILSSEFKNIQIPMLLVPERLSHLYTNHFSHGVICTVQLKGKKFYATKHKKHKKACSQFSGENLKTFELPCYLSQNISYTWCSYWFETRNLSDVADPYLALGSVETSTTFQWLIMVQNLQRCSTMELSLLATWTKHFSVAIV